MRLLIAFLILLVMVGYAEARPLSLERERARALVVSYAAREGVPSALAVAVARHESGFNPHVRGRAGEWGVMQIKCSTARDIGYRGACSGLANAETNIRWGVRYLAQAHRLAGGSECLTLSKYNGGHGRRSLIRSYCRAVIAKKPSRW